MRKVGILHVDLVLHYPISHWVCGRNEGECEAGKRKRQNQTVMKDVRGKKSFDQQYPEEKVHNLTTTTKQHHNKLLSTITNEYNKTRRRRAVHVRVIVTCLGVVNFESEGGIVAGAFRIPSSDIFESISQFLLRRWNVVEVVIAILSSESWLISLAEIDVLPLR